MNLPGHLNYWSLCGDPNACTLGVDDDLFQGIGEIYQHWSTDGPMPCPAADLANDVLMSNGVCMTGGIGVMVKDPRSTGEVLHVLHGCAMTATRDHYRKKFVHKGDVTGRAIETFELGATSDHYGDLYHQGCDAAGDSPCCQPRPPVFGVKDDANAVNNNKKSRPTTLCTSLSRSSLTCWTSTSLQRRLSPPSS